MLGAMRYKRGMIRRLLLGLLMAFALPAAASAQASESLEGYWTFSLDGTALFAFALKKEDDGWTGHWVRPRSFSSDGVHYKNLLGPPAATESARSREIGGWVELTFEDPRPGAVPDIFRFQLTGKDQADAIYAQTGFPALELKRADPTSKLGPWDVQKTYARSDPGLSVPGAFVQFSIAPELLEQKPPESAQPDKSKSRPVGR